MKTTRLFPVLFCFALVLTLAVGCRSVRTPSAKIAFNVRAFGAKGDGKTLDHTAINRAIEAAARAGGGTVEIPPGIYLCGSIHLRSNIHLVIDAGATILGAPQKLNAYDEAEPFAGPAYQDGGHTYFHNSLIWGENLTNVFISGSGMINGGDLSRGDGSEDQRSGFNNFGRTNARPVTVNSNSPPDRLGNKAIALKLCENVLIRDVTIFHGGHFAILVTGCDNMTIDNVTIDTDRDGMDIDCCRNTMISQLPDQFAQRRWPLPQEHLRARPARHHGKPDYRELPGLRFCGRHAARRHHETERQSLWPHQIRHGIQRWLPQLHRRQLHVSQLQRTGPGGGGRRHPGEHYH